MYSPSAERNKAPILTVLQSHLSGRRQVLELACGSLQHGCHFASALPAVTWWPTDIDAQALNHARALHAQDKLPANLQAAQHLDATEHPWPYRDMDAIYAANLLHISPVEVIAGLFTGASQVLKPTGQVLLYGPFNIGGQFTSEGNARFDQDLRKRNSHWGIRDLEEISSAAAAVSLRLQSRTVMPANNFLLCFTR